jgi:hypothetical protein
MRFASARLRPDRFAQSATTEILFTIGAGSKVIGRTEYDMWPDSARLVPAMGGGISVNVEAVLGAHPDLVLLYASQDNRSAAERLRAAGINTVSLKVDHISDFRRTTQLLGAILHDSARAQTVIDSVQHTLDSVRLATRGTPAKGFLAHPGFSPDNHRFGKLHERAGRHRGCEQCTPISPAHRVRSISKTSLGAIRISFSLVPLARRKSNRIQGGGLCAPPVNERS